MGQWLTALVAFVENLDMVPSTQMVSQLSIIPFTGNLILYSMFHGQQAVVHIHTCIKQSTPIKKEVNL